MCATTAKQVQIHVQRFTVYMYLDVQMYECTFTAHTRTCISAWCPSWHVYTCGIFLPTARQYFKLIYIFKKLVNEDWFVPLQDWLPVLILNNYIYSAL